MMLVQVAMVAASAVPPPPSPSPPPPVYTLMNEALSWSEANAACQAAGLQLATVLSAAENVLLLTAAAGNKVWIGGTDAASEGRWVWSPSGTVFHRALETGLPMSSVLRSHNTQARSQNAKAKQAQNFAVIGLKYEKIKSNTY